MATYDLPIVSLSIQFFGLEKFELLSMLLELRRGLELGKGIDLTKCEVLSRYLFYDSISLPKYIASRIL